MAWGRTRSRLAPTLKLLDSYQSHTTCPSHSLGDPLPTTCYLLFSFSWCLFLSPTPRQPPLP